MSYVCACYKFAEAKSAEPKFYRPKMNLCFNMFLYVYFNKYTSKCIHPRILKHTTLFKKEEDKAPPC